MLRNSLSAISLALLLILVSFTGCMGDSDSDSDDTSVVEDTTTNDQTETGSTTDETQDDRGINLEYSECVGSDDETWEYLSNYHNFFWLILSILHFQNL